MNYFDYTESSKNFKYPSLQEISQGKKMLEISEKIKSSYIFLYK